jgi:hypothetical protein
MLDGCYLIRLENAKRSIDGQLIIYPSTHVYIYSLVDSELINMEKRMA